MNAVWNLKEQFIDESNETFDCLIAEFLLSEGKYTPTELLAFEKYNVKTLDALAIKQKEALEKLPKLKKLFDDVEMPLVPILWKMEKKGIQLDKEALKKIGDEIITKISDIEQSLYKETGSEINLNSSQQVGTFLAEKYYVPLGKTKTGKYATNEQELVKYADQFPIIKILLQYRELKKLHTTYIESLIQKVGETGRVHTTYVQTAVSTGRLASLNPNLQNIPVNSEYGIKIKSCFIADTGKTFLSFDLSQQELRILAHLSGEDKLIKAFKENMDVHKTTASQIFSVPYDEVTKKQRQVGKTINFGIIYGMSSYGMSEGLHIPVEEAQKFIDTFYATYPKIKTFYDSYLKEGMKTNVVETILGRRRYVYLDPKQKFMDNGTRRVLMNYPIQGSAADLMKLAMVKVQENILTQESTIDLLLQIHDDLLFEVPDDEEFIKEIVPKIHNVMCNVYPLAVPVEIDVKIGRRWGELKLYEDEHK